MKIATLERPDIEALAGEIAPEGGEHLSLGQLVALQERRLLHEGVLARAGRSAMYAQVWRRRRAHPERVRTRQDLQTLPYVGEAQLLAQQGAPRRLASAPVWAWFASNRLGEGRKWTPYGRRDVLDYIGLLARMSRVIGTQPRDLILAVTPPPPRITNALPYLWVYADLLALGQQIELIPGAILSLTGSNWAWYAAQRQPAIIVARPDDALALRPHLAPEGRLCDALTGLRCGLSFGQPLGPHRAELQASYGAPFYDCYLLVEFPYVAVECAAHDGLHLWLDVAIPEVVPDEELAEEAGRRGYQPAAVFVDEARPGLQGELVLTTFGEALPLVRYRTGDRVRVVATAPCACGVTHPRVQMLGRVGGG